MPSLQAVSRVLCPVNRALEVRYVSGHLFIAKSQLAKVENRDLTRQNATNEKQIWLLRPNNSSSVPAPQLKPQKTQFSSDQIE
jgi:hypothetical protein